MNYKKIYDQLVEKCKVRGLDKSVLEGYFEKHHIVPKCMGGSDEPDNFVLFTAREHYIAHLLLKNKSRMFEKLRTRNSKKLSERNSNNKGFKSNAFKDLVGEVRGRLTVISFSGWLTNPNGIRTSTWLCECSCGNTTTLAARHLTKNSGTRSCGCARQEYSKSATGESNPFFGKKHTEEAKRIMSEKANKPGHGQWNTGLVRTDEQKRKVSEGLKARNRPAWEAGTVLTKPEQLQKWLMADYYYELYVTNTELTAAKFTTLYNRLHNDNLVPNTFNSMHREFVKGWIPLEDERWIKFSKEH